MMELLVELLDILTEEEKKKKKPKVGPSTAAKVYRRDYLKTKDKPYRKYDPQERREDDE